MLRIALLASSGDANWISALSGSFRKATFEANEHKFNQRLHTEYTMSTSLKKGVNVIVNNVGV